MDPEKVILVGRDRQGNTVTSSLDVAVSFTHGEQIQKSLIGPSGSLTPSGSLSSIKDGTVIESKEVTGSVSIAAGAKVTIRNTRIIGALNAPAGAYTVKATAGGGLHVTLDNCEVICRSGLSKTVAMSGDGNITVRKTLLRGGQDALYVNPLNSPGVISTGDPDIPMARVLVEDSWLGDMVRVSGGHVDCCQIDGGGYVLVLRSKLPGFNLPIGTDPLNASVDATELANSAVICSQNSTNPVQISYVKLDSNWLDGGNYTAALAPPDGLPVHHAWALNNRFGLQHRYAPTRFPVEITKFGNVWGLSGSTVCCGNVTAGQPVSGG
jgi:hypothetical protein